MHKYSICIMHVSYIVDLQQYFPTFFVKHLPKSISIPFIAPTTSMSLVLLGSFFYLYKPCLTAPSYLIRPSGQKCTSNPIEKHWFTELYDINYSCVTSIASLKIYIYIRESYSVLCTVQSLSKFYVFKLSRNSCSCLYPTRSVLLYSEELSCQSSED